MHQNGYYFSRPIYMHKFTSRDVPSERGQQYSEKATEIEVQQSHSYEIKPERHPYQQSEGKNPQQQVYENPVPVIVLKVPGPQKYALHLQALLQQYLEVRAAQFLKVLEEQDKQGHLMSPQHYAAPQEHVAYIPMVAITPMYQNYYQQPPQHQPTHGYRQQVQHYYHQQQPTHHQAQQIHHQAQAVHHQPQQQVHIQPQQQIQQIHHQVQQQVQPQHQEQQQMHPQMYHQIPVGHQSYYRHQQVHHHSQQPQMIHYPKYIPQQPQQIQVYHNSQPQQGHSTAYIAYVTPAYTQDPHEAHEAHEPLPTSENYPSEKHTQVIFKKKKNRHHQHPQPSITYHTDEPIVVQEQPTPVVHYKHPEPEEVYVSHPEEYAVTHQPTYSNHRQEHMEIQHVAAATERSKSHFNYHVGSTLAPTSEELNERHNPKRMVTPFSKEQFEKAKRMMAKRNRGSMRGVAAAAVVESSQAKEEKTEKKSS